MWSRALEFVTMRGVFVAAANKPQGTTTSIGPRISTEKLTFEVPLLPPLLRGWKPARVIVWFYIAEERVERVGDENVRRCL